MRVMAEDRYHSSQNPEELLWYAQLDSCDKELGLEECEVCRATPPGTAISGVVPLHYGAAVLASVLIVKLFSYNL